MAAASNVTIDDTSPLVLYEPADSWAHASGSDAQSYGNTTFSRTQVEGATAKFLFNGTGFWLYGATRPEYGQYILILDSQVLLFANATSEQPQFGQVLGGSSGLADGKHEVVFMAAGGGLVDIDAIMYETTEKQPNGVASDGVPSNALSAPTGTQTASASPQIPSNPNDKVDGSDDTTSDQAPAPSSSPSPAGATGGPATSAGSSGQFSSQPGDQSSPNGAQTGPQATTQADAQPNASAPSSVASPPQSQIATSTVNSVPSSSTISQAQNSGNTPIAGTTQARHRLPTGAIIGIGISVAVGVLLLIVLVWLFLRRRRARARHHQHVEITTPSSPILPLQNPDTQGGYFFGGFGTGAGANPMRDKYLGQSPPDMSQAPGPGQVILTTMRSSVLLPSSTFRDSSDSYVDRATLVGEGGTDVSSKMGLTRPPRPPELQLDA